MTPLETSPEQSMRFMDALAEYARAEFARHISERKDWNYHDILTREAIAELAAQKPVDVEPSIRMIFLGNLAVEKGHAEYDRVTSEVFEGHADFRHWKNTWVAEEEPHGASMQEWAMIRGLLPGKLMHDVSRDYLRNGLTLSFPNAAFGLAYPAIQEPATKITHKAVKDRLPTDEIHGRRILAKIIADEERHERFYANMVRHAFETGDTEIASAQMLAITQAVLGFAMPGIEHDIAIGGEITKAYYETKAFTVGTVMEEVLLPAIDGQGIHGWDIEHRTNLNDDAKEAQANILDFAERVRQKKGRERGLLVILEKARRQYGQVA